MIPSISKIILLNESKNSNIKKKKELVDESYIKKLLTEFDKEDEEKEKENKKKLTLIEKIITTDSVKEIKKKSIRDVINLVKFNILENNPKNGTLGLLFNGILNKRVSDKKKTLQLNQNFKYDDAMNKLDLTNSSIGLSVGSNSPVQNSLIIEDIEKADIKEIKDKNKEANNIPFVIIAPQEITSNMPYVLNLIADETDTYEFKSLCFKKTVEVEQKKIARIKTM